VLFHGLLESPENYESGVSELLQNLVSGRKKREELTPQELELLDQATLEFAAGKRPAPPSKKVETRLPPRRLTPPEEMELIYQEKGPPIPEDVVPKRAPTFWWRNQ
jgi:hypothetical protein